MQNRVKVRLGVSKDIYEQMKQHPEVDWNEAAINGIAKVFAAAGIITGGKGRQKPKQNHRKL